ncbi:hypothetical protein [Deinococcus peraridilitoris]|uniref:Uncharacterized protein n=1 Tax=Deinococcus peraridilitoris (strain DSM 19664 / LMG 22246 / CIP 109416 / KR-200) TaxID=937777 RepID=L0A4K1_DEIPD|nr:hypothetical protein [Deinococcus peraridilitoris]AFZ68087.1 hypothetical protein Deipe_2622 [Deinococcus peraridilitoris DSM 19664]
MSDDHRLSNIPPIGKPVEEIEDDTQNRVNPPATGEQDASGDGGTPILPWGEASVGARGPTGGTPSPGIPVIPVMGDASEGEATGTARQDDTTDNSQA